MSEAKRLLEQATPLPWKYDDVDHYFHAEGNGITHQLNWDTEGLGGVWDNDADPNLIVFAVNRLPDYEAAVEALERLVTVVEMFFDGAAGDPAMIEAKSALARLRESEPANVL